MSYEPTQIPVDAPAPSGASRVDGPAAPAPAPAPAAAAEVVDEHPEYVVAGAFAGAFLFAKILRRIGGGS